MDEHVPEMCDFTKYFSIFRNLHKLKICSKDDSKSLAKESSYSKELKALNILIESYSNKLTRAQKKKSERLATDLHYIDSSIESQKSQIACLKAQILHLDKELAKYSTVDEQSDAEKEIARLKDRLLNNNQKKNLLKFKTSQLNTIVTDMLLERQKFLARRKGLFTKLMVKKREINDVINTYSIINSNIVNMRQNKSGQQPKNHLQPSSDTIKLNQKFKNNTMPMRLNSSLFQNHKNRSDHLPQIKNNLYRYKAQIIEKEGTERSVQRKTI